MVFLLLILIHSCRAKIVVDLYNRLYKEVDSCYQVIGFFLLPI